MHLLADLDLSYEALTVSTERDLRPSHTLPTKAPWITPVCNDSRRAGTWGSNE